MVRRLVVVASIVLPLALLGFLYEILVPPYIANMRMSVPELSLPALPVPILVVISAQAIVLAVLGWLLWRLPSTWGEQRVAAIMWVYSLVVLVQIAGMVVIMLAFALQFNIVDVIK